MNAEASYKGPNQGLVGSGTQNKNGFQGKSNSSYIPEIGKGSQVNGQKAGGQPGMRGISRNIG